jgi:hypothetical protein
MYSQQDRGRARSTLLTKTRIIFKKLLDFMKLEVPSHLTSITVFYHLTVLPDLVNSTAMFGRLADPDGENNALSQVLYGLALR